MTTAPNCYRYKGWQLQQLSRGRWLLTRASDSYRTHHDSLEGGKAFIRCHGSAPNPDSHYEGSFTNSSNA
jgi:hypothetical protein